MANPRKALVIDDEPLARLELRRLLKAHPEVEIVGEGGTINEARELIGKPGYDLVFLDIQLRGGSGFDLIEHMAPGAQVVFVTAYDRYAVRAFEVNAVDYLLKPITAARLASSLQRQAGAAPVPPVATSGRLTSEDRVFVKSGNVTRFVRVNSIAAVRSCENYSEVLVEDGARLLVLRSLKSWEDVLPEESFLRVHRQAIVNLSHVRSIVRTGEDEVLFELTLANVSIPASRRQLVELRSRFAAAGLERLLP